MKKLMTVLIGVILGVTLAQAQKIEIVAAPNYVFPDEKNTWDKAYGIEGQLRLWANDYVALAGAGGIQRWKFKNSTSVLDLNDELGSAAEVTGDADMVPVGASLLICPIPKDASKVIRLTLEGGARYVFVNSNVKGTVVDTEAQTERNGNVNIDNGLLGLVGADLSIVPVENFSIFGGGGYQFDLTKGNVDWLNDDLGDNKMKGWFVRAGLTLMF